IAYRGSDARGRHGDRGRARAASDQGGGLVRADRTQSAEAAGRRVMAQYAWHFIKEDRRSGAGSREPWVDGAIERHEGDVAPCQAGLHSSPTPFDALQYAPGPLLSLVEIPDEGDDCIAHGS